MTTVWLIGSAAWSAVSIAAALLLGAAVDLADRRTPTELPAEQAPNRAA